MSAGKKIIIIAGPNGAGKTTFAKEYLPHEANCPIFVNADHIAAGIAPEDPEAAAFRAGRIMLKKIDDLVAKGMSFAIETTLSGRVYVKKIREWRAAGYRVELEFLSLQSPQNSIRRVALRVRSGGHNIPEYIIRRRFRAGLENFRKIYCKCVDKWSFYDNTTGQVILLESGTSHETR